jgi:shikimate kinase / 3-dehydroquinate synthase
VTSTKGDRIFFVGISGSGKSTVGPLLAAQLGWDFVDTDILVETNVGRSIPAIFAEDGEAVFRDFEASIMEEVAATERVVVSTGGGVPTTERGRRALESGTSIWLQIEPDLAAERLVWHATSEERPLLAGSPAARLRELLEERAKFYSDADATINVRGLSPEEISAEAAAIWAGQGSTETFVEAARVTTGAAVCPIFVGEGLLADLGAICVQVGVSGRAFVVTDEVVGGLFAEQASASLTDCGFAPQVFAIPSGEEHKTLATVETVYDWLLEHRVERSDFVVCLGGGVVTDLGGFAASTCLRGLKFVHVPTTLLAMADAAVGGKTGVDHRLGKNMIGAFVQPAAVIVDTAVLKTLPERQARAGMAELIKHGFILDAALTEDLERAGGDLESFLSPELIARSVAIKAAVVSEDERESGTRELLNYGHTIGHAIETVTGYGRYQHGEAVAIGMRAAGLIAKAVGMLDAGGFERQQALLKAAGLPDSAPGLDVDALIEASRGDKKVRGGQARWVLLDTIGHAVVVDDVPDEIVRDAVKTVVA